MNSLNKTCAGCDNLFYDSGGSAHCKLEIDNACANSDYSFWIDKKYRIEKMLDEWMSLIRNNENTEINSSEIAERICKEFIYG